MLSVLSITAPVFLIVFLGFVCARMRMFPADTQKSLVLFVFYCAMPCYLFMAMARSSPDVITHGEYLGAYALGLFCTAFIGWAAAFLLFKRQADESVLALMGASYTNSAFIGIPIIVMAFGEAAPVVVVTLFQLIVITTSILTMLRLIQGRKKLSLNLFYEFPKTVFLNPIVGGSLLGILFSLMQWGVPSLVQRSFDLLGGAGIPCALFALGFSLGGPQEMLSKAQNALVWVLVFAKIIIHPLVAFVIGHFILDLAELWLGALVIVSAMPTAMNNFVFAQRHGVFIKESSRVVFLSSSLSLFTLSALLWLFTR